MSSVYDVNRGINRPVEFRGLRSQYIWYLAIGLVCLMLMFTVCFIAGVPTLICVAMTGILGFFLFSQTYRLSRKYGQYGLMKMGALRSVPPAITCRSRKCFLYLLAKNVSNDNIGGSNNGSSMHGVVAVKGRK